MPSFGENLTRIRKEKQMRQAGLAKELGVTQQMISGYEKGIATPTLDVLIQIADIFDVTLDELVGREYGANEKKKPEERFLKYFMALNSMDQEHCITIAQTIFKDREIRSRRKVRSDKKKQD